MPRASPGQISREDAHRDRVTVWALGFQKLTDSRKLSKSAAPQGRVNADLTSQGKTKSLTCGLCSSQVCIMPLSPERGSPGSHCPRVISGFFPSASTLGWSLSSRLQAETTGSMEGGGSRGPPVVSLWTRGSQPSPEPPEALIVSPGRLPSSWSLISPRDLPGLPTGRKDSQHTSHPSPLSSALGSKPPGLGWRWGAQGCSVTRVLGRGCPSCPAPPSTCTACSDAGMWLIESIPSFPRETDRGDLA